ncbi:uncharacterized protein LOC111042633 isoform X1 [Myzus persicae]|uniref:uncharacterized protein LOC111042633 isoform X1 n=2 Tax=Myzus persicae TaxID=13164 RepID=UPI000B93063A|nr:uncharacterized protein LOC111042633 isoform X1 [Myzus persicae]
MYYFIYLDMDEFTKNWLNNVGLKHLVNKFEEEEINETNLLLLTESLLVNLIPKMGQRALIINELEKLKKSNEATQFENITPITIESLMNMGIVIQEKDLIYTPDPLKTVVIDDTTNKSDILKPSIFDVSDAEGSADSEQPIDGNSIIDNFIKTILEQYQDGLFILQHYVSNRCLNSKMRNRLCGVLIKHELFKSEGTNRIDSLQFSKIAKGIEELFPSETQHVYFIPYYKEGNKVSPNRGKLYDKYCNIKKK